MTAPSASSYSTENFVGFDPAVLAPAPFPPNPSQPNIEEDADFDLESEISLLSAALAAFAVRCPPRVLRTRICGIGFVEAWIGRLKTAPVARVSEWVRVWERVSERGSDYVKVCVCVCVWERESVCLCVGRLNTTPGAWVSGWVSEWVTKWLSEWERVREGGCVCVCVCERECGYVCVWYTGQREREKERGRGRERERDGEKGREGGREGGRDTYNLTVETLSIIKWWRRIGCLTLQVSFCKKASNYRALLRKMACEDKASYGSSPLCNNTRCTMDVVYMSVIYGSFAENDL